MILFLGEWKIIFFCVYFSLIRQARILLTIFQFFFSVRYGEEKCAFWRVEEKIFHDGYVKISICVYMHFMSVCVRWVPSTSDEIFLLLIARQKKKYFSKEFFLVPNFSNVHVFLLISSMWKWVRAWSIKSINIIIENMWLCVAGGKFIAVPSSLSIQLLFLLLPSLYSAQTQNSDISKPVNSDLSLQKIMLNCRLLMWTHNFMEIKIYSLTCIMQYVCVCFLCVHEYYVKS